MVLLSSTFIEPYAGKLYPFGSGCANDIDGMAVVGGPYNLSW